MVKVLSMVFAFNGGQRENEGGNSAACEGSFGIIGKIFNF